MTRRRTAGTPGAYLRFVPAVAFGLRAAALAGLVMSAGTVPAGLFDEPGGVATAFGMGGTGGSTCCDPK